MRGTNLIDRRQALEAIGLTTAVAALRTAAPEPANTRRPNMSTPAIACFIRYQIDPFQREAFREYAEKWGRIIPRCGGNLLGYFLPHEGTNDVGWGLIAFDSLAAYEAYRSRLRADPEARANLNLAQERRLVLREERTFVEVVEGTFERPPQASAVQPR